jgi:histone-lysine N-methyltransferase SETMAR
LVIIEEICRDHVNKKLLKKLFPFSQNKRFCAITFSSLRRMEASPENLRFYVFVEAKRGVAAKDILEHLQDVFGNAAPASSFVYKWYNDFISGRRNSVETIPRFGRPVSQRRQMNISRVFDFVDAEPKSSLRCIAEALDLSKDTLRRILVDDPLFRNVCSVWIPHKLSDDNRQQRLACCRSLLEIFENYSEFELLRLWATQDETWVPFDLSGSKQENMAWIAPQTPRPPADFPKDNVVCCVYWQWEDMGGCDGPGRDCR